MLKKVHIKNFLSCEDTEFDLEQITVLIGRNAAGKSNILKTLLWIPCFILGATEFLGVLSDGSEITLEFVINDKECKYIINRYHSSLYGLYFEEYFLLYETNEWIKIAERNADIAVYYYEQEEIKFNINQNISVIKSIITFLPEIKINFLIRDFNNYLNGINYYTLENIDRKDRLGIIASEYKQWLSTRNTKSLTDSPAIMRLLDSWIQDKELFNEISEIIGKNGLNLIDKIIISENNFSDAAKYNPEHHWYLIEFSVNNTIVHYHQLSYGTQRVLMILLALLYDKSTTLLIEQPEDGIHIGLLRKVLATCFEYVEVYNKQLIITTHSPDVIDMFHAENIRLVKMTAAGTKVNKLDDTLLAILPEYLENEGVLSDFIESMDDE
jgi:AAA15 family ATPase/GTPase